MIKIDKINKSFGDKKILNNVCFEIKENGVIALLGPNGAGKTTLMRILVGFLRSDSGKIIWNKKRVNTQTKKHKMRIGYLPENNPLYENMTVKEYLSFMAELKGTNEDQLIKVVKNCSLKEVYGQKIGILSKGYKQRVGLAAAILGKTELLILDEPSSGLDPKQIIEIRQLIKKLAEKRMIILSTHILTEAREISERILIISKGKIVLDENKNKIKDLEKRFIELTE